MMRVNWEVTKESKYIIHLAAKDVELEREDLEELEEIGLRLNEERSPKNAFAKGIRWGKIHVVMDKLEGFAGWQP